MHQAMPCRFVSAPKSWSMSVESKLPRCAKTVRAQLRLKSQEGGGNKNRCRGSRLLVRCAAAAADDADSSDMAVWDRVLLLSRKLDVAVSEENYEAAAGLRDERSKLVQDQPESTQKLFAAMTKLRNGDRDERLEAIALLADSAEELALSSLLQALHDPDAGVCERAEAAVWEVFCRSGDSAVDSLLLDGMIALRSEEQWSMARDLFSDVIKLAPNFPEAYNKRATVLYMLQDFEASIEDCKATVRLQPSHFGAYSGMGLCHIALGQLNEAVDAFQSAVRVNPRLAQIKAYLSKLEKMAVENEDQDADGGLDI
mmetsp:Transcript_8399/g.15933  ORF Transcript_8399/g.15933 Transcript_8399/m.15933 type:complete len:313 (+) Transcript_8399:50-988(+)